MNELNAALVSFDTCGFNDLVEQLVFSVPEPADCFCLWRVIYGSLRESDAARGKEIANTIETGLSIYMEPVILRDVEGTKDFTILCSALLKILVKRLFPAGRVQVC